MEFRDAFSEGRNAAGARFVRPGFAFDASTDVAFALGFPHARVWSDETVPFGPGDVIGAPRWQVAWPPAIGRARARVRGVDNVYTDGSRVEPKEAAAAVNDGRPVDRAEAAALVASGLSRTSPFGQLEMCLLLEADLGAANMLEIVLDQLRALRDDVLTQYAPYRVAFAQFVGFALLRAPAERHDELVAGFEEIAARRPVQQQPFTISGALDRALHGRAGAERNGLVEEKGLHASSLWFVNDDPEFVRDQILANHDPPERFGADARCAFLGGTEVVRYYVQRWLAVDPSLRRDMLHEFSEIADPAIVELMVMAGEDAQHASLAEAWLRRRADFARPILERLAAGTRKRMAAVSQKWLERLA